MSQLRRATMPETSVAHEPTVELVKCDSAETLGDETPLQSLTKQYIR
jgi:hypothetical protein